jgi:hypothetical protein
MGVGWQVGIPAFVAFVDAIYAPRFPIDEAATRHLGDDEFRSTIQARLGFLGFW